jgi:hypothetical protein
MDALVDTGHEALHTRERIKLFDDLSETGISEVYIYTNKLTDIESLCAYIKTLYVPEELYVYYAELLKEVDDTEVRLRKMPADKLNFYGTPVPPLTEVAKEEETQDTQEESQDTQEEILDIQKESEEIPTIQKSLGNLFSDALEELINSAAASDELTDKMKEIVLRRALLACMHLAIMRLAILGDSHKTITIILLSIAL